MNTDNLEIPDHATSPIVNSHPVQKDSGMTFRQ
jgi:hypothetical protein